MNINVTCISSGGNFNRKILIILLNLYYKLYYSGIPPPRVSWWKEHALLDDSYQVLPDGSVKNILHIQRIQRNDLNTVGILTDKNLNCIILSRLKYCKKFTNQDEY